MSFRCFCDVLLKIFLFIILLGPYLIIATILVIYGIIITIYYSLYWPIVVCFCSSCHKTFIHGCKIPWIPLIDFTKKCYHCFSKPIIKEENSVNTEIPVNNVKIQQWITEKKLTTK